MPLYKKDQLSYTDYDAHQQSYHLLAQDADYFAPFDSLVGWTLQAPEVDLSAPVTIARAILRRGRIFTQNKVARGQIARAYTFPLLFPQGGAVSTVLNRMVANFSDCERNFYLVLLCPENVCQQHFLELREGRLSPLSFSNDFVTVADDQAPIEGTSSLYTPEIWAYFNVQARENFTAASALYSIAYCTQNCDNCADPNLIGVAGGGVAAASTLLIRTVNGFGSVDSTITPTLSQEIIMDLVCEGSVIYGVYADTAVVTTATDGGIFIATNNGAAATDIPFTVGMFGIATGGGWIVAVGNDGTISRSIDGLNYTTLTALSATDDYEDIAYDPSTKTFWIVGQNATNAVVVQLRNNALTDVSATVAFTAANPATRVAVLGPGHILIGTSTGLLRESVDGGTTWRSVSSGTTSSIKAILGNSTRTFIGAGTAILERSPLTEREFRSVTFEGAGFGGNVTNGALGTPDGGAFAGINTAAFTTSTGEVVVVSACDLFV